MNDGTKRIELLVIDLVERIGLPQDIRITQKGNILYSGSVTRVPSFLLNEKVVKFYGGNYYNSYIKIEIE